MICFLKKKTANELRISDWSSDVCSSDLKAANRRNPLLSRKKLAARIAGVTHRTKLDELERHAVLTRPPLAEKYRAARRDQDADADKQDKGGKKRDTHQSQQCVDDAPHGSGPSQRSDGLRPRSEEQTSELQYTIRHSYAVL